MISMPPSERDLHAYVDHQLSDADRRVLETCWPAIRTKPHRFVAGNRMPSNCVRH